MGYTALIQMAMGMWLEPIEILTPRIGRFALCLAWPLHACNFKVVQP